jgi:hypothetical protein
VAHATISNLTQLHGHAFGGPLDRVCPLLMAMQGQVRGLGLNVKSGAISEARAAEILSAGILAGSDKLNDLTEALNEGQTATNQTWHTALTDLRTALEQVK